MSRVTDIRYVGYGVEDFAIERKFYAEDWGLVEVASEDGLAWFKTHGASEHHVVRLHESSSNCVEVIALAADIRETVRRSRRNTGEWANDVKAHVRTSIPCLCSGEVSARAGQLRQRRSGREPTRSIHSID